MISEPVAAFGSKQVSDWPASLPMSQVRAVREANGKGAGEENKAPMGKAALASCIITEIAHLPVQGMAIIPAVHW